MNETLLAAASTDIGSVVTSAFTASGFVGAIGAIAGVGIGAAVLLWGIPKGVSFLKRVVK